MVVFRRGLHAVPRLANAKQYAAQGIEGVYSPQGFQQAWLDYQKYLTTQLTMATIGTENEVRTPYQILLKTAKQTTEQHVFHYASQAHNNHLFFQQLVPKPEAQTTRPMRQLMDRLAHQGVSGVPALKQAMLDKALASPGQNWVFLCEDADKNLKVVECKNDGTPYYYGKNQSIDLTGAIDDASFDALEATKAQAQASAKDWTLPLLALNGWDHAYTADYGVNGKAEFLERAWDCINWDVVNRRLFVV
ncbi:hypothetical protein DIURU_004868 [Diutina rugosa]|uniref:Manganese/iron superoxide dismutase C-terminal domain-containing protein n=1 Tax=Diutina rugosa TaxID=5481 RepID=A0A642UMB6_DIURU|nr:uncharacterized protein DIURU_004868 [Diutina rugosa]KAA8898015.1 hypothetical protein DIURU_004868 [Diutina rugosa]